MSIDRMIFALAGTFIIASVALTHFHSENWMWFTLFIGANMLQSAFTGFCPPHIILKKIFGDKTSQAYD